jgi:hypothetical protein
MNRQFDFLLPKKQFYRDLRTMETVIESYIQKSLRRDPKLAIEGKPNFITLLAKET